MILEGAFYKLPELLLGHDFPRWQYEATLAGHLAMAVLLELNARNIPMPQGRIHIERPYPIEKAGPACRADLYVDLDGLFIRGRWLPCYGVKPNNWIEAKFHGRIGRGSGNITKVSNTGLIAQDLLRLCLFVPEEQSSSRDNGRYMLIVFNREPSAYLAFQRQSRSTPDRAWLRELLSPGRHQFEILLGGEAASFIKAIGPGFVNLADSLELSVDVVTYTFEPAAQPSEFLYWGYLIRIIDFTVRFGPDELVYTDNDDAIWSAERVAIQQRLAQRVLGLMTRGV